MFRNIFILVAFSTMALPVVSQTHQAGVLVDEIVAVIGNQIVLESDIQVQLQQLRAEGNTLTDESLKCAIFEELATQKLLVNLAEVDSLIVTDEHVESVLGQRVRYYISQFGSQERLEDFYGKSVAEIKNEFRNVVRNQLLADEARQTVLGNIAVTPSEVRAFFSRMPSDSIPIIPAEFVIGHIVRKPPVSSEELHAVRERLRGYRDRIVAGERFATFAALYSEDPGSAARGGELGFYRRGELFPEFEAVAFNLERGQVSDIVRTKAGFHIIQLIERRGESINVRHILLRPKPSATELEQARTFLDSLSSEIRQGNISFADALKHSDDANKAHGGLLINPFTGTTSFEEEHIDPAVFFAISRLNPGQVSNALPFIDEEGYSAFRLLYLKERTTEQRANLRDNYDRIKSWALEEKQYRTLINWIDNKVKTTFISINERYRNCRFNSRWLP